MAKFIVDFEQIWCSSIEVDADDEDAAWDLAQKIADGEDNVDHSMDWDPDGVIDVRDVF